MKHKKLKHHTEFKTIGEYIEYLLANVSELEQEVFKTFLQNNIYEWILTEYNLALRVNNWVSDHYSRKIHLHNEIIKLGYTGEYFRSSLFNLKYKTAYSPLFEKWVTITSVRYDKDNELDNELGVESPEKMGNELLIDCTMEGKDMIFRVYELVSYCL